MASSIASAILSAKAAASSTYLPLADPTAPEYRLMLTSSSSTGLHFYRQHARRCRRKRRHGRSRGHRNSEDGFPGMHMGLIHLRDLVQVLQEVVAENQRMRGSVHQFNLGRVDHDLRGVSGHDLDGAGIH